MSGKKQQQYFVSYLAFISDQYIVIAIKIEQLKIMLNRKKLKDTKSCLLIWLITYGIFALPRLR
uniref:Mobile element protein n=1 Tax=Rheinheimera sp. BAL341 TaxID=1708203 RepID=A0A486XPB7_9GAMM